MARYATHATMRAQNCKEYADLDTFVDHHPRNKYAYRVEFDPYKGKFYRRKVLVQDELDSRDNVDRLFRRNNEGKFPSKVSYNGQNYQIRPNTSPQYGKDQATVLVTDQQGTALSLTVANNAGTLKVLEWAGEEHAND